MLAFESLTPQELLKEVAEFIRMEAVRRGTEVTILDRKSRLTRADKEKRARAESADNALRSIALELEGAAIIPAGSILRGSFRRKYTETYTPEPTLTAPSPEHTFTGEPVNTRLLQTLRALTDWARDNTSPLDENTPHEILIRAVAVIDEADKAKG